MRRAIPVWSRLSLVQALIPHRGAAQDAAKRWMRAADKDPELRGDLVRFGGILSIEPVTFADGFPEVEKIDPLRQAYEKGRADLARQLLALMGLTQDELISMMEDDDV